MLKNNLYFYFSLFSRGGEGFCEKKHFFSDNSLTIEIQKGRLIVGN